MINRKKLIKAIREGMVMKAFISDKPLIVSAINKAVQAEKEKLIKEHG